MASYRDAPAPTVSDVIVDLSDRAQKLLEGEDISDLLTEEEEAKVVDYVRACFKMSYDRISRRYDHWLAADRAHDVYVQPGTTKFRERVVIADTRAIADTVITYLMAAITGRNPMFMLEGLNRRSRRASSVMERLLHQHMRRTGGEAQLAQMFLDGVRYGMAPTKLLWTPATASNTIVNFDPRRIFPDPRVQWGDWDHASFIGCADFFSYDALVRTGLYPKLRKYPGLRNSTLTGTGGWEVNTWRQEAGRGLSIDPMDRGSRTDLNQFSLGNGRAVNELWLTLPGSALNLPGIDDIWLLITVIDEGVVIRFQLNPEGRRFPWTFGSLYQDTHKNYGQGLYDLILPLHELATWLLRSRVDNVQASLTNLIFADPTRVSIPDLIDRNPWGLVRTLPGVNPGDGIHVASIPDVTKGHWQDISMLSELKQRVSAASDAQQGMPTSDVRTATEIQRLSQLGSQRLGVLARILSSTAIRPLVRGMISNLQDAINLEGSIRLDPDSVPPILAPLLEDGYLDFSVDDLQGDIDYLIVDGTLPIEPSRSPETWMNILTVTSQAGLGMELDQKRIALEGIRAMGISDIDQFRITPEQLQSGMTPSQQLQLMEKLRGASVMPAEQISQQAQQGNLIPLGGAAMTRPSSRDLAPSVQPIVRDYVNSLLEEQMTAQARDLAEIIAPYESSIQKLREEVSTLKAQLNSLTTLIAGAPTSQRRLAQLIEALRKVAPE